MLAARDVKDAYDLAREALNLAEKYQTPVILMSDLYIAEHYETVENLDTSVRIERGGKYAEENTPDYKRYALTDDGISPRAIPGMSGLMHNEDSDEHNEYGDVVSDAVTDPTPPRREQMEKRMRKLQTYLKEIPPTETYRYEDAEYAVVQWGGGTRGVVEEAIDILRERGGIKVGAIEVNHVFPLNPDIGDLLRGGKKKIIVVENNFSGQFARLLRSEFLVQTELVTKYDGESFYPGPLQMRSRRR